MRFLMQLIDDTAAPTPDELELPPFEMSKMDSFFWIFADVFKHSVACALKDPQNRQRYEMMNRLLLTLAQNHDTNIVFDRRTIFQMFVALNREQELYQNQVDLI